MTADVACAACESLLQLVQRAFFVDGETCFDLPEFSSRAIPAEHFQPWSGALQLVLPVFQELSVSLHMAPGRVTALLGKTDDLVVNAKERIDNTQWMTVEQALANRPERVHAVLALVEMTLGQIGSLRALELMRHEIPNNS